MVPLEQSSQIYIIEKIFHLTIIILQCFDDCFIGNSDYRSTPQSQTFMANATGNTLCVNIAIIDDTLDEFDEQFLVRFGNLPNAQARLGPIPEACITITDDDG